MKARKESQAQGFAWDAERPFPLIFAGLVALSLFAHVAAFFLFQVKYPQRVTIPPVAPQVTVLSPDLPEHRPLLAWIDAEDPALSAATARATVPGIQQIPYQPSYAVIRTWPHPAPREVEPVPLPSGRSGLEMVNQAIHTPTPVERSLPPVKTALTVSAALAARKLQGNFEVASQAASVLRPAQFLLGVGASGEIRYRFLHRPSGDTKMDEAASHALTNLSFSPSSEPITWGFMTIAWGDDVYASATKSQPAR